MKRCQIGVGGRNALDEAHSIMAECYGTLGALAAEVARLTAASAWIPVADRMPENGATVLACYTNSASKVRRIRAHWIAAKSEVADTDSDNSEYEEATDTYWTPEGWYEQIDNWGDYSSVFVCEGAVTHWMPLPPAPAAPEAPR
jgi:hypothetical protein